MELSGKVEAFLAPAEVAALDARTSRPTADPVLADAVEALMALGDRATMRKCW